MDERPYKTRIPSPRPISAVLSSFSHLGLGSRLKEYKVMKAWPESVGPALAQRACAERLMGSTLYCNVSTSAWMSELNYQKKEIINRLNRTIGFNAVTEIVFRMGIVKKTKKPFVENRVPKELTPEDESFIEGVTSGIKDSRLKSLIKKCIALRKG